jgi:hypothetical protein
VQGAVIQLPGDHPLALPVLGHDQVGGEILDEELGLLLQRLAIEGVQHGVAGAVGGGAGALHRRAFAEFGRVAAERALVDLARLGARERHPVMLQLDNRLGGLTRQVFHGVHVAEPVRALDGVVHVPLPVVRPHIGQAGGDATLSRHRVAAGREHLGDTGGLQPLLGHPQRRPKPRAPGADNHNVVFVINELVSRHEISLSSRAAGW